MKDRNVLALFLGKRARISEVMDTKSTPGEIKKMVRCTMKHAGYQGLMTGETVFGIDLIDGEVAPTPGGGKVSLRMVMFSNVKMQAHQFSIFAELHQVEEMGPTLAIIPACEEAERIVHMMNKQVAAFLFYYLTAIAALPKKFVMELLKATCGGNQRLSMGPGDAVHHHPPRAEEKGRYRRARKGVLVE